MKSWKQAIPFMSCCDIRVCGKWSFNGFQVAEIFSCMRLLRYFCQSRKIPSEVRFTFHPMKDWSGPKILTLNRSDILRLKSSIRSWVFAVKIISWYDLHRKHPGPDRWLQTKNIRAIQGQNLRTGSVFHRMECKPNFRRYLSWLTEVPQ